MADLNGNGGRWVIYIENFFSFKWIWVNHVRLRIVLDFVVCNQCLENLVVDASSEMSKC